MHLALDCSPTSQLTELSCRYQGVQHRPFPQCSFDNMVRNKNDGSRSHIFAYFLSICGNNKCFVEQTGLKSNPGTFVLLIFQNCHGQHGSISSPGYYCNTCGGVPCHWQKSPCESAGLSALPTLFRAGLPNSSPRGSCLHPTILSAEGSI